MPDPVGVSTHRSPLNAVIATSSQNGVEIVAAVANKKIVVVSWNVMAAGTTSVKWQSATTDISGLYPLLANIGVVVDHSVPDFGLKTVAGQALNINNSQAVQIGGYVSYYLE